MINTPKQLDKEMVRSIAIGIHRIVERREGLQENAEREIEYAFHAALLMVDAATRHQTDQQRIIFFQAAITLFTDIAETGYIQPICASTPLINADHCAPVLGRLDS